jgi:hypothetical protein
LLISFYIIMLLPYIVYHYKAMIKGFSTSLNM